MAAVEDAAGAICPVRSVGADDEAGSLRASCAASPLRASSRSRADADEAIAATSAIASVTDGFKRGRAPITAPVAARIAVTVIALVFLASSGRPPTVTLA